MGSENNTHFESLAVLDPEADHPVAWAPSAVFLKTAIVVLLVGSVMALVALRILTPQQHARAFAPLMVCLIGAVGWYLLMRKQLQATVYVLCFGVWIVITGNAAFTGGVRAPAMVAYPVIILMVGWMISPRMALITAALSAAATVAFLLAELAGVLPDNMPSPPELFAGDLLVLYLVSALLSVFLVRAYRGRLHELRKIGSALARRSQDLELSKAELNRAQAVANVGSWVYDLGADTMRLSTQTSRIFGLPADVVGNRDSYLARVHPDDRSTVDACWQEALQGHVFDVEHRIIVGEATRWIRQKAEMAFAPDGRALSAVGITQDISDRKQAQAALQDSEERFRTMTERSPEPILVQRLGVVLYVNAAAMQMFGAQSAHDLEGKATQELVHPDFRTQQQNRMDLISAKSQLAPMMESRFLRLDGTAIDVEVQGTAIVYGGEAAIHVSIRNITERKKAEARINELAFFDQLTGLPNRTFLLERLRKTMAASARSGSYCALLFIDLDDFKKLNDTMGHDMGDVLLRQVAQRLSTCVRADDTVGRLGGDEFVVLLENLGLMENEAAKQTEAAGEKIRNVLNQTYSLNEMPYDSTPSIGATLFTGQSATVDDVLKQADLAMYRSKAAGRNVLRFFNTEMERSVMARAALEAALREAVHKQQFLLHYQPQITREGRVVGAEALARWQHPQRGLVLPGEFISLAEDTGLIVPLGRWVLEAACVQLALWAGQADKAELTVSVNVSARQFHQADFVEQIMAVLEQTGARPHLLRLELTESVLVAHIDEVIAKMRALKERGVGFSLDDFGTGYSSLSYLSQLPLEELKIDRSFVMGLETSDEAVVICAATISLAHSLKLKVVAEGVETEAQRYFLQTVHRCDYLQGYLFSKPLALPDFEKFMARN
ncbi:MAG: hypothetical protein RIR45_157 [Pseudomonadota bacterium]